MSIITRRVSALKPMVRLAAVRFYAAGDTGAPRGAQSDDSFTVRAMIGELKFHFG
jgi:hypothetical protein